MIYLNIHHPRSKATYHSIANLILCQQQGQFTLWDRQKCCINVLRFNGGCKIVSLQSYWLEIWLSDWEYDVSSQNVWKPPWKVNLPEYLVFLERLLPLTARILEWFYGSNLITYFYNEYRVIQEQHFLWENVCHGLDQKLVVLRSSATAEYSASVACVVKWWRHNRDASAAPRHSATLHNTWQ